MLSLRDPRDLIYPHSVQTQVEVLVCNPVSKNENYYALRRINAIKFARWKWTRIISVMSCTNCRQQIWMYWLTNATSPLLVQLSLYQQQLTLQPRETVFTINLFKNSALLFENIEKLSLKMISSASQWHHSRLCACALPRHSLLPVTQTTKFTSFSVTFLERNCILLQPKIHKSVALKLFCEFCRC